MKVNLQYAERQLRHWQRKVAALRLTSNASNTKEEESGKETLPPTPPIRERAKGEETTTTTTARAREDLVRLVAAYNASIRGDIDAEYFVDYYADRLPRNWKARLRNWLKQDKSTGRIKRVPAAKVVPPKVYTAADWALCAERCANCRNGAGCSCGRTVPPDRDPSWPHTPEQCHHFRPLPTE